MPSRNSTAAVVMFLTGMLWSQPSSAEPHTATVTVVHSDNEKLSVRLSAELSSAGYDVRTAVLPPPVSIETLRTLARENNVVAVMQIPPHESAVRIWMVNRDAGVTELQEVTAPQETDVADTLVAFKAVELLRARLLTLPALSPEPSPTPNSNPEPEPEPAVAAADSETKPEKKPEPTPAKAAETAQKRPAEDKKKSKKKPRRAASRSHSDDTPAPPRPDGPRPNRWKNAPRLTVSLQPAAVFPFDGLNPTFNIGLSLYVRIAPLLGIEVTGLIPTFPQSVESVDGTFDLTAGLIAAGLRLSLLPPKYRVIPAVSATAGPLLIRTRGRADPGYDGVDQLNVGAVINGVFTLSVAINSVFSVRADASCGAAVVTPVFHDADDNEFSSYGRVLLTLLLGVEIRLL